MDFSSIQIPIPVALALVAAIGYLFGRRGSAGQGDLSVQSRHDLRRAHAVAAELEKIARGIRKSLAHHHGSVSRFKDRVGRLSAGQKEAAWKELCREAEEILKPTLQLAGQMANAYDELRQQSANLMTFTELRTDPLTGLNNRRGLDDGLAAQLALMTRYDTKFSVAIFDIDHFKQINDQKGHVYGDRVLQELARLFDECARETDLVARYGGDEFVVIMPQTNLEGACVLSERIRAAVQERLPLTVSGGVDEVLDGDTQDSLLSRADGALYSAKQAGRNCVFRHNGQHTEPALEEPVAAQ